MHMLSNSSEVTLTDCTFLNNSGRAMHAVVAFNPIGEFAGDGAPACVCWQLLILSTVASWL